MRDNDLDDLEFPPDDPTTAMLDRLDSDEDFGVPDEPPPASPAMSRREIDKLIDQVLDNELGRLNGSKRKA